VSCDGKGDEGKPLQWWQGGKWKPVGATTESIYRQHALNTMCHFLHVSLLLNNEQEPPVQIDRVVHSAVSVVAMTSVAAQHLQLAGAYNTKRRDLEIADFCCLLMEVV
jgi:hypothetical protein